jgi:CTP:phosphocholine cytidylyltransferase-like protein
LAAGKGLRLAPLTEKCPKPLVKVNGTRIIETMLDAMISAGIDDIVIVRGYLSTQFDVLLEKYPAIRFIDNPDWDKANNIASAYYARDLFENACVFEVDLFLRNPKLITKYQYESSCLGVPVKHTKDWCLHVENGIIQRFGLGGDNCYHMFGVTCIMGKDGVKLAKEIESVYIGAGDNACFWDEVALKYFHMSHVIHIRECTFEDVIEIDTIEDYEKMKILIA